MKKNEVPDTYMNGGFIIAMIVVIIAILCITFSVSVDLNKHIPTNNIDDSDIIHYGTYAGFERFVDYDTTSFKKQLKYTIMSDFTEHLGKKHTKGIEIYSAAVYTNDFSILNIKNISSKIILEQKLKKLDVLTIVFYNTLMTKETLELIGEGRMGLLHKDTDRIIVVNDSKRSRIWFSDIQHLN